MSFAQAILPEFDQEMANTRRVLEQVPDDRLDWQAGPAFRTIGWNANHLAEIPGWVAGTLSELSWDVAPPGGEPYQSPQLTTRREILDLFDQNVAAAREALLAADDSELEKTWSLLQGGQAIFAMPRKDVIRRWVLNHLIHHRAHLCVYLRLNDIAVPGMYGPSADG